MSHLIEKIRSVKFQLILIFLAFSVVSASGIAGISLSYLFRAEREMAVDQAVRYSEVIGARAQILVENTAKIYQWVNGRNVRIFLNTDGDKFSACLIHAWIIIRKAQPLFIVPRTCTADALPLV